MDFHLEMTVEIERSNGFIRWERTRLLVLTAKQMTHPGYVRVD